MLGSSEGQKRVKNRKKKVVFGQPVQCVHCRKRTYEWETRPGRPKRFAHAGTLPLEALEVARGQNEELIVLDLLVEFPHLLVMACQSIHQKQEKNQIKCFHLIHTEGKHRKNCERCPGHSLTVNH